MYSFKNFIIENTIEDKLKGLNPYRKKILEKWISQMGGLAKLNKYELEAIEIIINDNSIVIPEGVNLTNTSDLPEKSQNYWIYRNLIKLTNSDKDVTPLTRGNFFPKINYHLFIVLAQRKNKAPLAKFIANELEVVNLLEVSFNNDNGSNPFIMCEIDTVDFGVSEFKKGYGDELKNIVYKFFIQVNDSLLTSNNNIEERIKEIIGYQFIKHFQKSIEFKVLFKNKASNNNYEGLVIISDFSHQEVDWRPNETTPEDYYAL